MDHSRHTGEIGRRLRGQTEQDLSSRSDLDVGERLP